jgi:predicted ester cyclase
MADIHLLIREYFKSFNERRLQDAAVMFTNDAVIQHRPTSGPLTGPEGYLESARMAIGSFPDIQLQILHVEQRGDTIVEIDISATGTQMGDWTAGTLGTLKATGQPKTFRVREMLEIRGGKITFSSLTYDLPSLMR